MLLFIELIIFLPFGPAFGNMRECNLSLFASNVPNWFVEIVSVLMVSFTVSITCDGFTIGPSNSQPIYGGT